MQYQFDGNPDTQEFALRDFAAKRAGEAEVGRRVVGRIAGKEVDLMRIIRICAEEIEAAHLPYVGEHAAADAALWRQLGRGVYKLTQNEYYAPIHVYFDPVILPEGGFMRAQLNRWMETHRPTARKIGVPELTLEALFDSLTDALFGEARPPYRWSQHFDQVAGALSIGVSPEILRRAEAPPWPLSLWYAATRTHPEARSEVTLRQVLRDNLLGTYAALLDVVGPVTHETLGTQAVLVLLDDFLQSAGELQEVKAYARLTRAR